MRRVTDTSKEAYDRLKQTGAVESLNDKAELQVLIHPGHTYHELAIYAGIDKSDMQKALTRLKAANRIKFGIKKQCRCKRDCNNMYTWIRDEGYENPERYFNH